VSYEIAPEYRMSYDDRLTEEAWAIARSKRIYEAEGRKWEPWMLNIVTINLADIVSGEKAGLEIDIPEEEDYYHARQRVDAEIEEGRYRFARLKRAKLIYTPLPQEPEYISPRNTTLNASWNGMRDPLTVDEFFFMSGISDDELKSVFHFDPVNMPRSVSYAGGFYGFAEEGRQRLADIVGRPIAFVQMRSSGRRGGCWDMSSKEIFVPFDGPNVLL
jgi:hypothetical protein